MQLSNIPTKFQKVFAEAASPGNIRTIPVTTADANAASQTTGWPANAFVPEGAGGVPPDGRDMNGLDNMLSAWAQWVSAGGALIPYDATFQGAIGGYPKWAIVNSLATPGTYWQSTADNNTTNPDTGGAGWVAWPASSSTDWGSPGSIGQSVPNSGKFTTIEAVDFILSHGFVSGTDLQINGVGFSQSFGTSGYQRLPSGLIMQWGRVTSSTGVGDTINFPLSFPTNCAIAMDVGNDNSGDLFAVNGQLSGPPYSSVKVWTFKSGSPAASIGISYVALGN